MRLGHVEHVYNLYGPSEDTTYSTWERVPKGETRSPAIGRPLENTQGYVLDRHLRLVPVGCPVSSTSRGMGLARGYLLRPELTAERFLPDPFSRTPVAGCTGRATWCATCRMDAWSTSGGWTIS